MSLRDDKNDVLDKISTFSSLLSSMNKSKSISSLDTVSNKNDTVSYLLDVLKVTVGTEAVKQVTGEVIGDFIGKSEPKIKETLKKQFNQYNSNYDLPENFKNNGINLELKMIDVTGKIKLKSGNPLNELLINSDSFDKSVKDAINTGNIVTYNNFFDIKYTSSTDRVNIKPNSSVSGLKIGEFFDEYLTRTEILNKKEITAKALDVLFGNISTNQNKTLNEIIIDEQINAIFGKIIDGENNTSLTADELSDIEKKALDIYNNNMTHYVGCGYLKTQISDTDYINIVNNSINSDDYNQISSELESVFNKNISDSNNEAINENIQTIKDSLFKKLINLIVLEMSKVTTLSPQIITLKYIMQNFQTGSMNALTTLEYINGNTIFINCLVKELIKLISEKLFNIIKNELMNMVKPIINLIVKEKTKQFKGIIRSLIKK